MRTFARCLIAAVVVGSAAPAAARDTPAPAPATDARIPAHLRVTVSGDPASPQFLIEALKAALFAAARDAGVAGTPRVLFVLPAPQPLDSGFLTSYTLPWSIIPATGNTGAAGATVINVDNSGLPPFSPPLLSFADDPEKITAFGVLSRTTVAAGQPVRIYYYHENIGERRRVCVVLAANGSVMTHVQLVGAAAGPSIDVMGVGHAVSRTFVTVKPPNEGVIRDVAGGKPIVVRDTAVNPGDGIVGALDLRVLDGGPLTVTVLALPLDAPPAAYLYAPKLPDDGHERHGTFALAGFGRRIIAYTAGGRAATYTYGSRTQTLANVDPAAAGRDYGDYGVLQHLTFDLANPAAVPVTVYLYEKPLGGVVRSSFAVNGSLIDVGCVRVAKPYGVTTYALAPHATGALDVLTMTDGGSNYPLEIGVTTEPPLAQTPKISAPDGCFPKPAPRASSAP